jgi:hypothetical protein
MLMKHLLFSLLILIIFKGTESNHLNSKLWPFSSSREYKKVNYGYFGNNSNGKKIFLKIAFLLRDLYFFNDFSYKAQEGECELVYKCESGFFAKTYVYNVKSIWDEYTSSKIVIEKCLEHLINNSPNDIESLMNFIITKRPNFSINKVLPNEHKLTIKDLIDDQFTVQLKFHVKFALLYIDEENYFLKSLYEEQYKLGNSEKQPTLYILYDTVNEKYGNDNIVENSYCIKCHNIVTKEFSLSTMVSNNTKTVFSQEYFHLKCLYQDIKKYDGNLEEYLMREYEFEFGRDYFMENPVKMHTVNLFIFELFNRFFSFKLVNKNVSIVNDYLSLYEIQYVIKNFIEYSDKLVKLFFYSKHINYDNAVNEMKSITVDWKAFESLNELIAKCPYSDISEIGKPIGLKMKLLSSKVNNNEKI